MSLNEKSTETHECQDESSDRPIRTKTKSIKALEAATMEKTKLFWKSHKDLEQNTNALFRCDPFSPYIPELKEKLKISLENFEKELTELKQIFSQHGVDSSERQSLLATADKWLKLAYGALSSANIPILQPIPRDQTSHVSSTSSSARRLEARARLAEEKAKQEYEEVIRQKTAELTRQSIELEHKRSLQAAELDRLRGQRDLKMAEAAANVYENEDGQYSLPDLPDPPDRRKLTQEWINKDVKNEFPSFANAKLEHYEQDVKTKTRADNQEYYDINQKSTFTNGFAGNGPIFTHQYPDNTAQNNTFSQSFINMQQETNKQLIASLAKQSLPKCEPDVFAGDAALFLPWKSSFRAMINDVDATPDQELTYLLRYTSAKPRDLVNTFRRRVHPNAHAKVQDLWKSLEERFGHSAEITNALLKNLQKAAEFKSDDREAFQHFHDVCEDVNTQIPYLKGLSILNSSYYMKTLVEKVPRTIRDKWESKITKHMVGRNKDDYPPFHMFVEVVHNIALKKNHPAIVRIPSVDIETSSKSSKYKTTGANHRANYTRTLKTEIKHESNSRPSDEEIAYCTLHPDAKKPHTLVDCRLFAEKPVTERQKIVREANICFRCLAKKHFSKFCKADVKCTTCGRRHLTLLHQDINTESATSNASTPASSQSGERVESSCMQICGSHDVKGKSCGKIVLAEVFDRDDPDIKFRSYINLDEQSNHTLGTRTLMDNLHITGQNQPYTLETCHGKKVCSGRRGFNLGIRSLDGTTFNLPTVIESANIPADKNEIPTPEMITHVPHLASVANSLPPFEETTGIHLLIGRDAPELLKVRDFINGPVGAPWAQLMDLGWTVSGELCLDRHGGRVHVNSRRTHTGLQHGYVQCQNEIRCKEHFEVNRGHAEPDVSASSIKRTQEETLSKIANNEFLTTEKDSEIGTSPEDRQFLECMEDSFHINKLGNWEAPLPFRNQEVLMPDNRIQAERRFKSLQKNFSKNPQLKKDYFEFMDKILKRGHASRIPKSELATEPGKKWYLPHFAVYHPQKPTQVRIVFDSSAEHEGTSLNQELLQGPDLMNKLFGRLLRFRQHNVAIMCDIEQMFHSFYVNETYRNFLRFLWFEDDTPDSSIVEYRMNVHLFGNGPSPAIATYGLRKAAEDPSNKYGETTRKFVNEDFYVDDGVYSCKSTEDAIALLKSAQEMLLDSKLRLHKVVSNYPDVMKAFPQQDLAKGLADLDLSNDQLPCQRTLGVQWNLDKDVFTFKIVNKDKPYTRRGVLSVINSLYDPFGFLAPFTIVGKKILQNLIQLGNSKGDPLGWDDPLPAELETEWYKWHSGLPSLTEIEVQRCFHPQDFGQISKIEVHAFSDASKDALGAVLYLRLINTDGQIHTSFVKGSAKVKPQKHLSIPRMELCAAVLLVTTVKQTLTELEYDIESTHYYTDSKVVLGYIMNESRRFYVYVANRVELIRSLTSPTSWRYIESESNPADIATRGCSASNLMNTLWLKGPDFLASGTDIPFNSFDLNHEDQEVRDVKACVTRIDNNKDPSCSLCEYFKYFGNWTRLIKSIARLKILIRQKKSDVYSEITSHVLLESELVILKHVQQETFPNELKILVDQSPNAKRQLRGSRLYNLDPFVHEDLIRVGGRLRQSTLSIPEKHPVILPKNNHVTQLVSLHYHERIHHQGRSITHGAIRQAGFWILGGSDIVNSLIRNCIRCKLLRQPTEAPKMADLPEDRLQQTPPFTNVGMDAFGPWEISTRKTRSGSVNSKRWGIIFTCLYSRAIHIEVVDSMDTSAFINALRRFFAIRGPVSILRSDCGTNFVGARNELKEALKKIDNDHVKKFLLERECQWLWNPPHASHFGGIWERQIGTVRRVLEGMLLELGKPQLTHDLLITLMSEAAAIVNSRPLSAVPSDDSNNPMPLSPANILTMKSRPYTTVPGIFDKPDLYCQRRWRRVQYLADQFWLRWRKEYLQSQQPRRKWNKISQNLAVNDIVLIHEKDAVRGLWPKGRIIQVQPSPDGVVRQAEVETCEDDQPGSKQLNIRRKRFLRPTTELVFLFRPGN